MWWKDTTLLLLVATFAALMFVLFRRRGSCQRRAAYRNGDEDYEDSGVDCDKVLKGGVDGSKFKELERFLKNSARKGRSWKSAFEKDPKKGAEAKCWANKDGGRLYKAYAAGDASRLELDKTVAERSSKCQFGKCPNLTLRSTKPCRASDKNGGYAKCCEDSAGTVDCVKHDKTDRNWNCKNVPFSERECTPNGGAGDYKKYCYKGTEPHNRGKCCAQPWSGTSGCMEPLGEPAAANSSSTDNAASAEDPATSHNNWVNWRVQQCKCDHGSPARKSDNSDAECVENAASGLIYRSCKFDEQTAPQTSSSSSSSSDPAPNRGRTGGH